MARRKLSREEVRRMVDTEELFSRKWDKSRRKGSNEVDANKSVETWLAWMQVYLQAALKAATLSDDKTVALHNLRCVLNLGEACAQYHGLPPRPEDDDTNIYE